MSGLRGTMKLLDIRWRDVLRAVALGVLALGCSVGLAAASAWLIARASQMPPVLALSVAVVGVRAFGIGRGLFRYLERLASHDVALHGVANLRANLYDKMAAASAEAAHLQSIRRGELLDRVGADVDEVGNLIVRAIIPAAIALVLGVISFGFLWMILPQAALALLIGYLIAGVAAPIISYYATANPTDYPTDKSAIRPRRKILNKLRSHRRTRAKVTATSAEISMGRNARAEVSAHALRIIEQGQELRVAGKLDEAIDQLESAERNLQTSEDKVSTRLALASGLGLFAQVVTVVLSLLVTSHAVGPAGLERFASVGRALAAVAIITPMAAFEATAALPAAALQLRKSKAAAARLNALLPVNIPISSSCGSRFGGFSADRESAGSLKAMNESGSKLELRNVTIGWPNHRAIQKNLNLHLKAGECLALMGASGSGKSTLLMTAAGLLPPREGEVRTTGRALFVAEDGHIFGTTLYENLRVASGDLTATECEAILHEVGLGPWLQGLPAGLQTLLGPNATNISGGERRRLLVARALLSPAQILLIDEPAEHLDEQTADALLETIIRHAKAQNKILIIATHRPINPTQAPTLTLNQAVGLGHWRINSNYVAWNDPSAVEFDNAPN